MDLSKAFDTINNPARRVSDFRDDKNLWQWSRLEVRVKGLSSANPTTKTIHHHHLHHNHHHHELKT